MMDINLAELVNALDDGAREFYEERAAIIEYMGGMPRAEAERRALKETQEYILARLP
jgi:hypothetical protein